jgi:hypothetical protein
MDEPLHEQARIRRLARNGRLMFQYCLNLGGGNYICSHAPWPEREPSDDGEEAALAGRGEET